MPAVKAPPANDAVTEISDRVKFLDTQITEADRMVGYFTNQAKDQQDTAATLRALRASYIGLLEDAGASLTTTQEAGQEALK